METATVLDSMSTSLQPGDHLCCFYEDDEQYRDIIVPYLRDGLEQNQKLIYVYEEQSPAAVLACLNEAGVAYEEALARGQLVFLSSLQTYLPRGYFDSQAMLGLLGREAEQAIAEGYTALRSTGEMNWAGRGVPGGNDLFHYESRLNHLSQARQCIILCQYDRRRFDPRMLMDVLLVHPKVLIGPSVYDNFYYLPPESFLSSNRDSARFDKWFNNLVTRQQMEWQIEQARRDLARRVDEQLASLDSANQQLYDAIHQRLGIESRLVKTNAALREAQDRYKTIFDTGTDAIFIFDLQGQLLEANQAAFERLNYSYQQMVSMNLRQIVAPVFVGKVEERLAYLRTHEDMLTFEAIHMTSQGEEIPVEVNARRIQYVDGYAILSVARDITERKRAEQALRESEAKFRGLVERSPDGVLLADEQGHVLEWNASCESIFGIPAEQALGRPIWDLYYDMLPVEVRSSERYWNIVERVRALLETGKMEWQNQSTDRRLRHQDGRELYVQTEVFPIRTERGMMLACIFRDITEHRQAELELEQYRQRLESMVQRRTAQLQYEISERQQVEETLVKTNAELSESEERYRALVNQSPVAIFVVQDGRYVFVNPAAVSRLHYENAEELVGRDIYETIALEYHSAITGRLQRIGASQPNPALVVQFLCKDGSVLHSESVSAPILYQGRPAALVIGRDVTDRVHYEQQLEASLAEKEVMLREIHHRVKNNLNVIIALIDLQKANQKDPQVLEVFKELQSRAYIMALVHERLYRSPNLARIDFNGYLQTLASYLYTAYGPAVAGFGGPISTAPAVDLQVKAENVELKIETAIPLGLMINELVTNALKYAFPSGYAIDHPRVLIRLEQALPEAGAESAISGSCIILTVQDNGIGLPAGLDWRAAPTLGLQLVQVLARQLGGQVELISGQGVTWRLIFEEKG